MIEIENAFDYDIAVDLVNMMKMMASRRKEKATSQEERAKQQRLINMYSPIVKKAYATNGSDI